MIAGQQTTPNVTRIREVSMGLDTDDESQRMRRFFDRGNASAWSAAQRRLAPTPQRRPA